MREKFEKKRSNHTDDCAIRHIFPNFVLIKMHWKRIVNAEFNGSQCVKREPTLKTGKNAKRRDEIVQMTMQFHICFDIKIRWRRNHSMQNKNT